LKRKYPTTGKRTLYNSYYRRILGVGKNPLLFCPPALDQRAAMKDQRYPVINLAGIKMVSMIRNQLDRKRNPYDPSNQEYFDKRRLETTMKYMDIRTHHQTLLKKQKGLCGACGEIISHYEDLEVHHIKPLSEGGKDLKKNRLLVHKECHRKTYHESKQG